MVFQAHPGDVLAGKYRVDRVLGIGGMGMVVAATHLELDQPVALKFMLGEHATSQALLDRFLREARAVAKLRSEHVCRLHDVGRLENGSPYIVMELLKGEDFAAVLSREGALTPGAAVDFLLQAIEGVAEAHAEGIIHRDLKPGNLFITTDRDGSSLVKVLDFGISKSQSAPATKTGDIMGSPGYMAPEQMSNAKATDARADVWSLGVILYQALANRMPWTGESLPALCMSVMTDPPPPLPDTVPAGLRDAVMKCLVKEKDGRYATVAELAAAIAPFGGADANATATRISKIVRVPTVSPVEPLDGPAASNGATQLAGGAPPPVEAATVRAKPVTPAVAEPAPAPVPPVSTFTSSAAEIALPPPAKSKKPLLIGGGVVVAGGVALALAFGGGSKDQPKTSDGSVSMAPPAPGAQPPPDEESPVELGKKLYGKKGCNACHTITTQHGVGPSFAGSWGTQIALEDGTTVKFDDAYVRESILKPTAKIRRGFPPAQPSFEGQITDHEIRALIAYFQSVAKEPGPPPDRIPDPVVTTEPPKPVSGPVKPATTTRPVTKPTTTTKPATETKPTTETKPATETKPGLWEHMTHDKKDGSNK